MKLKRASVVKALIKTLQECQEALSGKVVKITEDCRPIGDLADFDSLTSVSATTRCLDALGVSTRDDIQTLFSGKNEKGEEYARTVREVADRIVEL